MLTEVSKIYYFHKDGFDEIKTQQEYFEIYYLRTSSQGENYLKIKIKVKIYKENVNTLNEETYGMEILNELISKIILISVIIIVAIIIIGAIIILVYCMYCKRSDTSRAQEWVANSDARYNKIISQSTEEKYDEEKGKYNQNDCMICLSNFEKNVPIQKLKCNHIFHTECINAWIKSKILQIPKCPICNIKLTKEKPPDYIDPNPDVVVNLEPQFREQSETQVRALPTIQNNVVSGYSSISNDYTLIPNTIRLRVPNN